ncbi:tryptophan--tRNA ligase, cytoplasmic-like [Miscanthus floridulus]|uniref:tryptophan--tRNA ligase, cytoplasmic-like n=1 Tax=Miscanthus floridulus TaxID=154761 RepID=UPI00345ACBEE
MSDIEYNPEDGPEAYNNVTVHNHLKSIGGIKRSSWFSESFTKSVMILVVFCLGFALNAGAICPLLANLLGENTKMSASNPNSAIYVTDSSNQIKEKVNSFAFSGGRESTALEREYGANIDVDVPIKYLNFFLEDDDELEHIKKEYKEGRMLTGEVKQRLIAVLSELVVKHQRARAQVTEEMVDAFMAVRPLPNMFG